MITAGLNVRKATSGEQPFSPFATLGDDLHEQNVKSSIVIYNGITFGFDSDAQREVPKIIAEAKERGDNVTLAGYGFGEAGGRGLTAALGARGLQFGAPLLARGAAAIPYGTATLTGLGKGLRVAGAAGTGWLIGTAINEGLHGNTYEATAALTDATNLGTGTFGSLFRFGPGLSLNTRVTSEGANQVIRVGIAPGQAAKGGAIGTYNPATGNLHVDSIIVFPSQAGHGTQVFGQLLQTAQQQTVFRGVTSISGLMAVDNAAKIQQLLGFGFTLEQSLKLTPAGRFRARFGYSNLTYDGETLTGTRP